MKKILIISNRNPFTYFGGVEFVCKMLAEKLKKEFKIFVVCSGNTGFGKVYDSVEVFQFNITNIPVIQDFIYAFNIKIATSKIEPDIVIDNGSLSFLNDAYKYKTISICHGTNYGVFLSHKNWIKKIYKLYWYFIQYLYLKKVFLVLAVSKLIKQEIIDYYKISENKIQVIDNGTFVNISESDIYYKYFYSAIFVSNDHERKGISIVEKIAEKFPKLKFKICGTLYKPNLPNIEYLGVLNSNQILEEMKKSDFFIFPTSYEGQSLAVLDALAAGLPVVLSREGDTGFISDKINGFICDNNNLISYIQAIETIYTDKDLFSKIKKSNIFLMRNYTWDIQIKKYSDLISKII